MALMRDHLVKLGGAKLFNKVAEPWFQLEFLGEERLPSADEGPCLFVMNHTAFFALEVYLLGARLLTKDPRIDFRPLVWSGFVNGPAGAWFRSMGCEVASIANGTRLLQEGKSVVILPEGIGATDVRRPFNPFRTGYLRILKEQSVPIIPVGFYGIDESIPWHVMHNKLLVDKLMKPVDPTFDFFLLPRFPILRPTKVVFSVGEPIRLNASDLETDEQVQKQNERIKTNIMTLVADACAHRKEQINKSLLNRWYHRLVEGPNPRYG